MSNFFEYNQDELECKYNILVWPNITYSKDLEKDSFVVVLHNTIKELNKKIPGLFWTIVTPYTTKSLEFPNSEQVIYDLPSYPNSMRVHFDVNKVLDILDWRNKDFDILYSLLPEHTLQLTNLIYNQTNLRPKVLGQCHWYEIKENTMYEKTTFNQNILGTLEMEECGVNSIWLKNLILDRCKELFSKEIIDKLSTIIQPHYLGTRINNSIILPKIPKSILFNHRPNEYTGWNDFIKTMDKLYDKRKDFTVYVTLADEIRPYIKKVNLNKEEYNKFLTSMLIGVGYFKDYSAWSISVTDGLSAKLPYLLPNKLCYPEMVGGDYPLFYENESEFLSKLENILDNGTESYNVNFDEILEKLSWEFTVSKWFNGWDIFNSLPILKSKTESYMEIYDFIKSRGCVSKHDIMNKLKWGMNIPFSPYRNTLRTEKNIKFVKNGYQYTN